RTAGPQTGRSACVPLYQKRGGHREVRAGGGRSLRRLHGVGQSRRRRGLQRPVTFAAFDVIVVPFPYSDRLAEKRRPALVLSTPAHEANRGLVWVAMITSAAHPAGFADCEIHDTTSAGLSARSILRSGKLATI